MIIALSRRRNRAAFINFIISPVWGICGVCSTKQGHHDKKELSKKMSFLRSPLDRQRFSCAQSLFELLERRALLSGSILDTSFGTGGAVQTSFAATHEDAHPAAVLVEHDYKSIVVGSAGPGFSFGGGNFDFVIARYTATGQPDTSFGSGGTTLTDISGGDDFASAAALQGDGKTVVAGYSGSGKVELARYTTNGKLDSSFGTKPWSLRPSARTPFPAGWPSIRKAESS